MATPTGLEGLEKFDALLYEIEEKFASLDSLLQTRRCVLVERVNEMKELFLKHQDQDKAIEQMEEVRRATNEMLRENVIARNKEESVNYWDGKIRDLQSEKAKLEIVPDLKFVLNSEDISNFVKRICLRDVEAVEFSKRKEPLLRNVKRGVGRGELVISRSISIDETTDKVFVANETKNEISVYSSEGEFINSFQSKVMKFPYGICVFSGFVFLTNRGDNSVLKFTKVGELVKRTNSQETKLSDPRGLYAHGKCVYVCSSKGNTIEVFNLDLAFVTRFGGDKLETPLDIKLWKDKIFVLTLSSPTRMHTFSTVHKLLYTITLELNYLLPYFFTIDMHGYFIVSDEFGNCLRVFNPSGKHFESLGQGFLPSPQGVATDNKQRVVVINQSTTDCFQIY